MPRRRRSLDRLRVATGLSGGGWGRAGILVSMATLSRADVEHVAHLARLGLTDVELTRLEGQLNHILDQYAILAQLPTDDIPPTAQTIELQNILRADVVTPSLAQSAVLAHMNDEAIQLPAGSVSMTADRAPTGSNSARRGYAQ